MTTTINKIESILAKSGCSYQDTTLYVPDSQRKKLGYDSITYYRGGDGYPKRCFVKERLEFNPYGAMSRRVSYTTAKQYLALLMTQTYWGGMWRDAEQMKRINNN